MSAFRITTEGGEELGAFPSADYAKGENGALYAAARRAHVLQKEGRTVLLSGPEGFTPRRYAPEYLPTDPAAKVRYTWRVPCSVAGCRNWIHPNQQNPGATCREHFAASPETAKRAERLNAARRQPAG